MITSAESRFAASSPSPATLGLSLAELGRDRATVFDEHMGALLVLRHKDVSAAMRNHGTFSTRFYGIGPMESAMIAADGAEHTRQRRVHNRFFSPAASARYAARIVPVAERTFGAMRGQNKVDLVEEALARYPMEVFLDLLGVPNDLVTKVCIGCVPS